MILMAGPILESIYQQSKYQNNKGERILELSNSFSKFLKEIRPTENQNNDYKTGHKTLRDRIHNDDILSPLIVESFLQGSYRRSTAVRPKNGKRADVDIIIVTKLSKEEHTPDSAMNIFIPFLNKWYEGKYRKQGRSFGIELSYIDMDLVITSAPSEAEEGIYKSDAVLTDETLDESRNWRLVKSWAPEGKYSDALYKSLLTESRQQPEWKTEPLWIPDRINQKWEKTDPLDQIKWTQGKNARCNNHYVNIVKAIKWWQRVNYIDDRPKGYPLEHLIGYCCPDGTTSVGQGVFEVFNSIISSFKMHYDHNTVPFISDHGVEEHNVLGRISIEEFHAFYEHILLASAIVKEAYKSDKASTSSKKWRELLGDKFPLSTEDDDTDERAKGPFIPILPKNQVGDMAPRKYGMI